MSALKSPNAIKKPNRGKSPGKKQKPTKKQKMAAKEANLAQHDAIKRAMDALSSAKDREEMIKALASAHKTGVLYEVVDKHASESGRRGVCPAMVFAMLKMHNRPKDKEYKKTMKLLFMKMPHKEVDVFCQSSIERLEHLAIVQNTQKTNAPPLYALADLVHYVIFLWTHEVRHCPADVRYRQGCERAIRGLPASCQAAKHRLTVSDATANEKKLKRLNAMLPRAISSFRAALVMSSGVWPDMPNTDTPEEWTNWFFVDCAKGPRTKFPTGGDALQALLQQLWDIAPRDGANA